MTIDGESLDKSEHDISVRITFSHQSLYKVQGVIKNYVFSQFTAYHPLHVEEQLILARDLSVQSLLLADLFL